MPPPKPRHGLLVVEIAYRLRSFVDRARLGRVMAESGVRTESDPDTVRGPDASFMSAERFRRIRDQDRYPTLMPEICIEVVSQSDTWPLLREKAAEYLAAGVLLVWVVDGDQRKVHVFSEGAAEIVLGESDTLDGGAVLPGFALSLKEFFAVLDGI